MPDISKIEVLDGTTYDIKDATARASIPASHPYILQSDVDYFDDVSDLPASPSTGQVAFVKGTVAFPSFVNIVYPVGSIYISVNSTDPGTLFGGTWEQLKDRFLLAAGDTYAAGGTGGSAAMAHTHNLSENGYAKITAFSDDDQIYYQEKGGRDSWTANYKWGASNLGGATKSSGWGVNLGGRTEGASDDNNMPPYLAVYMWKRTA